MADNGGLALNNEVYSAADRQRLDIYREILNPVGLTSSLTCYISFRGCTTGVLNLNRHGRSSVLRAHDLERLRRVLPLVGMADAAVASQCAGEPPKIAPNTLSRRELQVARLIRTGLQNKEIACFLGTSVDTVRKQTIRVYEKLGVSGRVHLVARFGEALGQERREENA
jgi:DNA-binding CsgD family transcriptional regulator